MVEQLSNCFAGAAGSECPAIQEQAEPPVDTTLARNRQGSSRVSCQAKTTPAVTAQPCYEPFSSYMAADGNVLIGAYQASEGTGTWILSYHPGAKQIKVQWANSGGDYAEGTITKENGKWTERTKGAKADGSPTTVVEVLTTTDEGETHHGKRSGTVDGKAIDDGETVWNRVHKP